MCTFRVKNVLLSSIFQNAEEASQLAFLGYFVPEAKSQMSVKCCFCYRMFAYGLRCIEFAEESSVESRIKQLIWCHSVFCSTCPISMGLYGDNRPQEPRDTQPTPNQHVRVHRANAPINLAFSYPEDLVAANILEENNGKFSVVCFTNACKSSIIFQIEIITRLDQN